MATSKSTASIETPSNGPSTPKQQAPLSIDRSYLYPTQDDIDSKAREFGLPMLDDEVLDVEASYKAAVKKIEKAGGKVLSPAELIARTQAVLAAGNGVNAPELLAEDYKFVAPIVGPLGKDDLIGALKNFDLKGGIPDLNGGFHNFEIDPFNPMRVWYVARAVGTHTGTIAGKFKPTNIRIQAPPQACSMIFNEQGQVTQQTIGYVMDKTLGNTGGLGGVFGIFYAIGSPLPFPEAKPAGLSFRYRAFNALNMAMNYKFYDALKILIKGNRLIV